MLNQEATIINGDGFQTQDYVYVGGAARINLLSLELNGYYILSVGQVKKRMSLPGMRNCMN